MKNLDPNILRQQRAKEFSWRLLVNVISWSCSECRGMTIHFPGVGGPDRNSRTLRRFKRPLLIFQFHLLCLGDGRSGNLLDGQHLFYHQTLRDNRFELVVHQVRRVNLGMAVTFDQSLGEFGSQRVLDFVQNPDLPADQRGTRWLGRISFPWLSRLEPSAEKVSAFAADSFNLNVLARLRVQKTHSRFQNVRIERSRK